MPVQSRGDAQMPPDLMRRLVEALERIAAGQAVETSAELRTTWQQQMTDTTATQTQVLDAIADKLGTLVQPRTVSTEDLELPQQEAVLRYDAFRTALGRPGAAAMVMGERSGNVITITAGQLPAATLQVVGFDAKGGEVGRGNLPPAGYGQRSASLSGSNPEHITRFEVWDLSGSPIRFGLLVTRATRPTPQR